MTPLLLILTIAVPVAAGLLVLLLPSRRAPWAPAVLATLACTFELALAVYVFPHDFTFAWPWMGFGAEFALKLSRFSAFILLGIATFSFLVTAYSAVSLAKAPSSRRFHAWVLFTVALSAGAVLADNLILFLVFWEGLLLTLFAMIAAGKTRPFATAVKAFVIVGLTDLALMFGVMLTGHLAGTMSMSAIRLPLDGLGAVAFLLLMIGAMGKAGAMPFHSWIPDAAIDAPLPFMALLPGSLEKLLGIYFLARISLDLFVLTPESWVSPVLMGIGAATILLAVLMALVQKDYKKLLAYHAISQVGYMILGIGTALPVGIVGGLFHMVNNAIYKSSLFLSAGAVEKEAGTTDLRELGGLGRSMPITTVCFLIAAASISGVPPFNGFFSKELVYDGALERGWIFYAIALAGSFFTAASFLKLGHAAFFGKPTNAKRTVKEAPWPMLLPMIILAGLCVVFGVANSLPLERLIQPVLGTSMEGAHGGTFAGFPTNMMLVGLTAGVLALAVANHAFGVHRTGKGIGAVDHIHHAPGLSSVYKLQATGALDPYRMLGGVVGVASRGLYALDRAIDWVYSGLAAQSALAVSWALRKGHNGNVNRYVLWALVGAAAVVLAVLAVVGGGR
ncbi:MAG: proton-conducting transporter membrane subunit [Thermotogota bacterium]